MSRNESIRGDIRGRLRKRAEAALACADVWNLGGKLTLSDGEKLVYALERTERRCVTMTVVVELSEDEAEAASESE